MKTIGRHLIAEYYGCKAPLLNDVEALRIVMIEAAEIVGATVLGHTFHGFAPQGASGTVVIAESHLSVHTWPERGYVAVDIYTCGGLDPRPGFELLSARFESESCRVQEILRGLPEDFEGHGMLLPDDVSIVTRTPEISTGLEAAASEGA